MKKIKIILLSFLSSKNFPKQKSYNLSSSFSLLDSINPNRKAQTEKKFSIVYLRLVVLWLSDKPGRIWRREWRNQGPMVEQRRNLSRIKGTSSSKLGTTLKLQLSILKPSSSILLTLLFTGFSRLLLHFSQFYDSYWVSIKNDFFLVISEINRWVSFKKLI